MRKISLALFAAVAMLAGCAINPSAPPPTVAQVTAQLCPLAKEVGSILLAPDMLPVKDQALILKAKPDVDKMCAVGATVVAANLTDFGKAYLPDIIDAVNGSLLQQVDKLRISGGLLLVQVAINGLK